LCACAVFTCLHESPLHVECFIIVSLCACAVFTCLQESPFAGGLLLFLYSCGYVAPLLLAATATVRRRDGADRMGGGVGLCVWGGAVLYIRFAAIGHHRICQANHSNDSNINTATAVQVTGHSDICRGPFSIYLFRRSSHLMSLQSPTCCLPLHAFQQCSCVLCYAVLRRMLASSCCSHVSAQHGRLQLPTCHSPWLHTNTAVVVGCATLWCAVLPCAV
jgi:NADH:ubiquinone oxidoreductase subunit 6 (subunit J)